MTNLLKLTDLVPDAGWSKENAVFPDDSCGVTQHVSGEPPHVYYRPHPHRLP